MVDTRGAVGATTIDAQTQDGCGDQRHVKIFPSSRNDAHPERSAAQRVAKRLKSKHSISLHLKLWKKKAARLRTLLQFSARMYTLLQFAIKLQTQYPYAVAAAFVVPLIGGIVYEAVQRVEAASEEVGRLREAINDLKAGHQPIESKGVEGEVVDYTESGWPKIGTGGAPEEIPLYGIDGKVNKDIERKWIEAHTNQLSCKVVEMSSNGLGPRYRCLAANTFDLSEAMLLNGAATISHEAGQSYRDAQDQACAAKRGIWLDRRKRADCSTASISRRIPVCVIAP
jgi:hypothetical protein